MNKAILVGNLARDVEVSNNVANFTIAVNRTFKNKDGEYDADFIRCVAFQKRAEILRDYTKKGSKIAVEGWIKTRSYENDAGDTRYVTEVEVDNVELLGKKD